MHRRSNSRILWKTLIYNPFFDNYQRKFFYSQLRVASEVKYPTQGDFLVNDKYLFEVGGSGKTFDQIADVPDSFLAVDDIEVGHGNRIPLWMFGLLY